MPAFARRYGLAAVAVLLVVLTVGGLVWFMVVRDAQGEDGDEISGDCAADVANTRDFWFSDFSFVPDDPELGDAVDAFRKVTGSSSWRFEVGKSGLEPLTIERQGDTMEFARVGDDRGRIAGDQFLHAEPDSSFWVASCQDPTIILAMGGVEPACTERIVDGDDVTFHYRHLVDDDTCTDPAIMSFEVVLRNGRLHSWSSTFDHEGEMSTFSWTVQRPEGLDDPWPWQVVPGWFVDLVD